MWWFKDAPLPVPLITGGGNFGILGSGASVLAGNGTQEFDLFSGVRASVGVTNCMTNAGIEIDGFFFPQRATTITAGSNGSAVLARPVHNLLTGAETSLLIAAPGSFAGTAEIRSSARFWGTELNGVLNLCNCDTFGLDLLVGGRYLALEEGLEISQHSTPLGAGIAGLPTSLLLPAPGSIADSFHARNTFYGGQLGCQGEVRFGRVYLHLLAKAALGDSHQVTDVLGVSGRGTPGGLLAVPSNSGHDHRDDFTVVPEGEVNVGYQVTNGLRVYLGYTFLYWDSVIRPGDQLNRTINPAQVPSSIAFGSGAFTGQPGRLNNQTDFWAQGFNFGLALRY
jgi:hypothetical protein